MVLSFTRLNRTRLGQREWRLQQLKRACSRFPFLSETPSWNNNLFYFSEKHHYFYCAIPKVASTSWTLALLKIAGMKRSLTRTMDIHNRHTKDKYFKRASLYTTDERQERLEKYFKFVFVREPLERLASAYRFRCSKNMKCRQKILQSPGRSLKKGKTTSAALL